MQVPCVLKEINDPILILANFLSKNTITGNAFDVGNRNEEWWLRHHQKQLLVQHNEQIS